MKRTILLSALLSAVATNAQPPSYIPAAGLVAWYPFNGNATDESGNGHELTVNGATLTADRNGLSSAAYAFNGTGDHMNGGSDPAFEALGDRTVSVWINADESLSDDQGIVGCIGSSGQLTGHAGYLLKRRFVTPNLIGAYEDSALWGNGNYGAAWSDGPILPAQWHHLVQWRSGGITRLYVDGVLQASSFELTPYFLNSELLVGWSGSAGQYFHGAIDDIGLWDRALSKSEIQQVFAAGDLDECLVAHYPFEGNANDITGNGHDGTVFGAVPATGPDGSGCYQFNGTDDFIRLSGAWDGLNGTVTAWIYPDALNQFNPIFSRRDTTVNGSALELVVNADTQPDSSKLYKASDFRECQTGALFFRDSEIEIQAGAWTCVAMTADDLGTKLYINGQEVATYGDADPGYWFENMCAGPINTYVGMSSRPLNTEYFKGRIDDLRIYNCALSAAELADLCSISTSASAQAPKSTVTTFPNPTTGLVTISGLSPEAVGSPWHLVDALGRKLPMQTTIAGGSLQLDLSKYPAGLYVIQSGAHRIPVLRD